MRNLLTKVIITIFSSFFTLYPFSGEAGSCRSHKSKNIEKVCSADDLDCLNIDEQKKLNRIES